jgi:hypothetical protein
MNKADLEHYHGGIVRSVAISLSRKPWESLSYRSKQIRLNHALSLLEGLTKEHTESFIRLGKSLCVEKGKQKQ